MRPTSLRVAPRERAYFRSAEPDQSQDRIVDYGRGVPRLIPTAVAHGGSRTAQLAVKIVGGFVVTEVGGFVVAEESIVDDRQKTKKT